MISWNNGLSLNMDFSDKTAAALTKQIFDFYESVTRPPSVDVFETTNENWDILKENYVFRSGSIFYAHSVFITVKY